MQTPTAPTTGPVSGPSTRPRRLPPRPAWPALIEVVVVAVVVVFDFIQPTLVILVLLGVSLLIRRQGLGSIDFVRPERPWRLVGAMAAFALAWTLVHLALFIPVLERLTGSRQDMSAFADIEGNPGALLAMLALSWTLAAVGEETAYRGYAFTRMTELFSGRWHLWLAVLASSILFGLAHTEQGVVGVALATIDGLVFALIRLRTGTLWASILAHGFINTIGFVAFFFVGPVYGLW